MSTKFASAQTPEEFFSVLEARLNSLDVEVALELFHPDCVMIDASGNTHRGHKAIRRELARYFSSGIIMNMKQRELFVSGDTALLISEWSYDGVAKNGDVVKMGGTAADVMRRGDDGIWRYIIDNPFGTQLRNSIQ